MTTKDLLVLVETIKENLKVFGQLFPEFDADKRKDKNNLLQFPVKNRDCVTLCYVHKCNAASTCD